MAKIRICFVSTVISYFILFATVSAETVNRREKRQFLDSDVRLQKANIPFKEFYPRPSTMDEFRRQRLYPVKAEDRFTRFSGSTPMVDLALGFNMPFFGFKFTYIWIQQDGYLLFSRGLREYSFPVKFPSKHVDETLENDPTVIAPWFSKQDIPIEIQEAGMYVKLIQIGKEPDDMLRERIILDFREGMIGAGEFTPSFAIIITWRNVTFANRQNRQDNNLKTNTYQVVIATDELKTYCMFNYDNIEWISHGDPYDGKKASTPFVGFNAGNRTRAFELRPYSQDHRISLLQEHGYTNKIPGRWIFQINEEVWPGSCVYKQLDPNWRDVGRLTFFPRYGNMLGGTMVNVTGPCFGEPREKVDIRCRFEFIDVDAVYRDQNHVTCFQPFIAYHGYIDLSVSVNGGPFDFVGKYYVLSPEIAKGGITIQKKKDREQSPSSLTLMWHKRDLTWRGESKGSLYLWGYRESSEPSLTFIDELAENAFMIGSETYELDLMQFDGRRNWGKTDMTFGFISMNHSLVTTSKYGVKQSSVIWSGPTPLAWYFEPQWEKEHKYGWKEHFCKDWFQNEKNGNRFAITVSRCPCTAAQAEIDRGRFTPDIECNTLDKGCETFHNGAERCVLSGRPSIDGAGQVCCYDKYNELLRTGDTVYGGRPSRSLTHGKHPYKLPMMLPTLSHWLYDVMPFFFCCEWASGKESSETCQMYKYWRTSQDCTSYQTPGVASVFGDPHFKTFDHYNYTFNGKGEFVLVQADSPYFQLDIHGRFEGIPGHPQRINGTKLTAVAANDNHSSTVEFRLRPDAARWQYHLFVLVDKEYVFFWDDSLRIQTFKGVTLYQPAGTWNMSHIVAMFDSGAGVEVLNNKGNLLLNVYLPLPFMNLTKGLLGNWSRDPSDDFVLPDGRIAFQAFPQQPDEVVHERFAMKWRLTEVNQKNIKKSLFHHDPVPFAEYDDMKFKPEFRIGKEIRIPENFTYKNKISQVCSDSASCLYDLVVTGNMDFAEKTRENEGAADALAIIAKTREVRCPELPTPLNGKKGDIRYHIQTIVRFSCDPGYRLTGHVTRECRDIGLWTWGVDAECISNSAYMKRIAGIAVGILIPIMLILCFVITCFILRRRRTDTHYTGERGMPNREVVEIKSTANRRSDADYESKEKLETET